MNKHWKRMKLGELCSIELGGTPSRKYSKFWDTDKETSNVWLSIRDMPKSIGSFLVDSKEYLSDLGAEKVKIVEKGTLLLSFKLSIGRLAFAGTDLRTNEAIAALKIFDNKLMTNEFLCWYLAYFDWDKAAEYEDKLKGKTLNKAKLKELEIYIPLLSEQRRIVSIVDEAFEAIDIAIDNTKQNLTNARELFDSYLNDIFIQKGEGWVDEVIEDHVKFIDYRGRTPNKTEKGMRLITAKNVKMGFLQTEPQEFVDPDIYNTWMTRGIPKKYDVLFTTEAPMGNVAQLDTDEKVAFAQRIIIMQPNPKFIDSTFLKFLLLSNVVQKRIKDKGTGATVQGIKASLLKKIVISYPSEIINQKDIVLKLNALRTETERLKAIYRQKLTALNELKQSILHKAFTGELTADKADLNTNIEQEAIAV